MTQGEIRYDHAALAKAAAGLATRIGFRFDLTQPNALWNALSVRAKAVGAASQGVYVTGHLVEEKEWTKLSEEIAVHETSFYRHAGQFRALEGTVLPELVRARRDEKRLIVWSAACSTGEEPYSLAIAVHRLNLGAEWRVRIVATDLSTRALALAQSRLFDPFRLRNLPPGYLEHYFDKVGNRYRVRESIASLVEFAPLNLVTGAYPVSVRQADLVLCENVLIYFREEVTREVIGKLRDTLREGGYLFLGYAETLWGLSDGFTPVSLGDTYVYRRTPMAKVQNLPPPEPSPGPRPARVSASLAPSRPVAPARPAPAAPAPAAPAPTRSGPAPAARSGPPQGLDRLLATEDLAGALKAVVEWRAREPKEPVLHLEARLLAALGQGPKAAEALRKLVAKSPLYAPAYVTLGILCERQGEDAEAVAQLQQALYLDPKLPLAWFHLGNVYQRQKDARRAAHAYRQTLKLAPHFAPEWDSGFTKALLVKVCEQNIARLSR